MKQLYVGIAIVVTVILITHFEMVLVFVLSGTILETSIALSPSMMLAVSVACVITLVSLRTRRVVFDRAGELYDLLFGKKKAKKSSDTTSHLPKRRFGKI